MKEWNKISEELVLNHYGQLDDFVNILLCQGYGVDLRPGTDGLVSVYIYEGREVPITVKALPCHDCKRCGDCL